MTLRTAFTGTRDIKLNEARVAGEAWVSVTNLAALTTDMAAEANSGKKSFYLEYAVSYQSQDLRTGGPLWGAFKSGVIEGFAKQDIMVDESTVTLNGDDNVNTFIRIDFAF